MFVEIVASVLSLAASLGSLYYSRKAYLDTEKILQKPEPKPQVEFQRSGRNVSPRDTSVPRQPNKDERRKQILERAEQPEVKTQTEQIAKQQRLPYWLQNWGHSELTNRNTNGTKHAGSA